MKTSRMDVRCYGQRKFEQPRVYEFVGPGYMKGHLAHTFWATCDSDPLCRPGGTRARIQKLAVLAIDEPSQARFPDYASSSTLS